VRDNDQRVNNTAGGPPALALYSHSIDFVTLP
jgi:hypothetical protein